MLPIPYGGRLERRGEGRSLISYPCERKREGEREREREREGERERERAREPLPPRAVDRSRPHKNKAPNATTAQQRQAYGHKRRNTASHSGSRAAQQEHKPQQQTAPSGATPYAILRAQSNLQELMPTLIGDQVPLAMEALQLLQGWTTSLWGEPIRLTWRPQSMPAPAGDRRPAGAATGDQPHQAKPAGRGESWDTEELPGTNTEEEAWGLTRRRRRHDDTVADTPTPRTTTRPGTPPTSRRLLETANSESQQGVVALNDTTHRRRRMHALFDPSP